jgi:MtrB/PioB family decaheme-associated outer membrane protein
MRQGTPRAIRFFVMVIVTVLAFCLLASTASGGDEGDSKYHDLTTLPSSAELGFLYNTANDYKFGDFTGLVDEDFSVLGNIDIRRRSAFDADRAFYYRLRGLNLGLDSRYVDFEYKQPGVFGLSFIFDEMPKYTTDSSQTFYVNPGNSFLMLPAGWDPGPNPDPDEMTELEDNLRGYDIKFKRRTLGGGVSWVLPSNIDMDASYSHQTKKGDRLVGAMIGRNGGDPRSVVVPEPIDYITHQIDSHIRYTGDDLQLQLQYYASGFDNNNNRFGWESPYTAAGGWNPVAGFPTGIGQKAQMPDNWFHQFTTSGGFNLPANSRLMLNTAFGWGIQNDDYLPYTVNSGLLTPFGLPRNDLDGLLQTRLVTVQFVSKPISKLGIKVGYRWSDRDNDSKRDTYFRVRSDAGNLPITTVPDQNPEDARINRPYSFTQHKVDADLSYDIYRRTKLTLFYDWDRRERDYQEVKTNNEHTFGVKLITRPNSWFNGGGRYERSYRDGSHYNCVRPLIKTEPAGLLTNPGCPKEPGTDEEWENQPSLRKYYMADVKRDNARLWFNLVPMDNVSLGFNIRYIKDDYHNSKFGLTEHRIVSSGVDLSYAPTNQLQINAFYNYEKSESDMESVTFGGNPDDSYDPLFYWNSEDRDVFQTVGVGVDYDVIPDCFSFGVQYLYVQSKGSVYTDSALGDVLPTFPDNKTNLHDVSVYGNFQITDQLSMRVGYLFEDFESNDWAKDKVCPQCLNSSGSAAVIASGEHSPDYSAHLVSWSLIYEF